MANPEHVAILRQGVEVWNKWREEHRPKLPYLLYANRDKGIRVESNFNKVDLSEADFFKADLSEADLVGANLRHAVLFGANLSRANLIGADLSNVGLHEATFSDTSIGYTSFEDVDLSRVKGLDTIQYRFPSSIGIDTIINSHGKIPEIFLRKAGIPQSIIEQIPALIDSLNPIDYYTCFISYSSKDQGFADRLYSDLQSEGVRCWFAPHDMRIGDKIRPRIDESIRLYDKLLLVLSEYSVASQWVEHEVETALGKELEGKPNVLFPIRLDNRVMGSKAGWASHIRLTSHIGDFTHWKDHGEYQKAFNRLLRDLKAEA